MGLRRSQRTTKSVYRVVETYSSESESEDEQIKTGENVNEVEPLSSGTSNSSFTLTPAGLKVDHLITQSFLENQGSGLEQSLLSFVGEDVHEDDRDWDPSQIVGRSRNNESDEIPLISNYQSDDDRDWDPSQIVGRNGNNLF